ncbi:hypothetical protein [Sphingobium sp. LSP13-1-1.1]|uniref:hypothetical protein n=1 Tax=Sphingobium sp. LSP13-1-1.1 TaxID=3135234 RepID=UPI00343BD7F8
MSYSAFSDQVLQAVYGYAARSSGKPASLAGIFADDGIEAPPHYVDNLRREWTDRRLADFLDDSDDPENAYVELTAEGMRLAESTFNPARFGQLSNITVETVRENYGNVFNSSAWTGIEQRLASDPAIVDAIRQKIVEIDSLIEKTGLTNFERDRAKAITEALRSLINSPEPEWRAVVMLLTSPSLTAIINLTTVIELTLKLFGIG